MASIGQELLDVPFPEMVKSMGLAIAEAQFELDNTSLRLARMMAGEEYEIPNPDDPTKPTTTSARVLFDGEELSLMELGFTPTFYQFVDTIIEVKVSISMSRESQSSFSSTTATASAKLGHAIFYAKTTATVSSVSAAYASKYQYSAEGSSLLRTKLVPVPPPAILEERIRLMLEKVKERKKEEE
jgi:hypothetical protein